MKVKVTNIEMLLKLLLYMCWLHCIHSTVEPTNKPSGFPTIDPTITPTSEPTTEPSIKPTSQPTIQPSYDPTIIPTTQPSSTPSNQPSSLPSNPSCQPTFQPTIKPSCQPSNRPSSQPSNYPSTQPSKQPSSIPSIQPTLKPTMMPSQQPNNKPSQQPSQKPSTKPSCQPTTHPTKQPSNNPSRMPSQQPSSVPSTQPSINPFAEPSQQPTSQPSYQPSKAPSCQPSLQPSLKPSIQPTKKPSTQPSNSPSRKPSKQPLSAPSTQPSLQPIFLPSCQPTNKPTRQPSQQPLVLPSHQPSSQPSIKPSHQPVSFPSSQPTSQPFRYPTTQPSRQPFSVPTNQPVCAPSYQPSKQPSSRPTMQPSSQPSHLPSSQPSRQPTNQPSLQPSHQPLSRPSRQPSSQPSTQPSSMPTNPTSQPSKQPSSVPSTQPTKQPSFRPSKQPISAPSLQPSKQPNSKPSNQPSHEPSQQPSLQPSTHPSHQPSYQPSTRPTRQPSSKPTNQPSRKPSQQPSVQPSNQPSHQPFRQPSSHPSNQPSIQPTKQPSKQPMSLPSTQPSIQPSTQPSLQPNIHPSCQPTVHPSYQPSNQPSNQPTSVPSPIPSQFTLLPEWERRWLSEVNNITVDMDSSITQTIYSELIFNFELIRGSCAEWESFLQSSELLSMIKIERITNISLTTVKLLYDYYKEIDHTPETVWCSSPLQATKILSRLIYSTIDTSNFALMCDNHHWQIRNCMSGNNSLPSVCVDCPDPCTIHCSNTRNIHFISPCQYTEGTYCLENGRKYGQEDDINILSVLGNQRILAPSMTSISISKVTAREVTVEASLNAEGGIYCGTFLYDNSSFVVLDKNKITLDDIRLQANVGFTPISPYKITLTINQLAPISEYVLYCFTFSPSGDQMSKGRMLAVGKLHFQSGCCKELTATVKSKTLYRKDSSFVSSFLHLAIDALPSSNKDLKVTLHVVDQDIRKLSTSAIDAHKTPQLQYMLQSLESNLLYPNNLTITTKTSPQEYEIRIDSSLLVEGFYQFHVVLSGLASSEYKVIFENNGFQVININTPPDSPPLPKLLSAVYSPSGDIITVRFDSNTNQAELSFESFSCSKLFEFSLVDIYSCRWIDSISLVMRLVAGKTQLNPTLPGLFRHNSQFNNMKYMLVVGETISLREGVLKAFCPGLAMECSNWPYCDQSSISISISSFSALNQPIIKITAPNLIGSCNGFVLDISNSMYFQGGAFYSLDVSVYSPASPAQYITSVYNYILYHFMVYSPYQSPIPIPIVEEGGVYSFVVRACNVFNLCSTAIHTLYILNISIPYVLIEGDLYRSMYRNQPLVVNTYSYFSPPSAIQLGCSNTNQSTHNVQYRWQLQDSILVSYSNNPTIYRLPGYSLAKVDHTYYISFKVQDVYSVTTKIKVYVKRGNIIAGILGSNERTIGVGDTEMLQSISYDEDIDLLVNPIELSYQWSCICALNEYSMPLLSCAGLFSIDFGKENITASVSSLSSAVIWCTLTVSDIGLFVTSRSSQASVFLKSFNQIVLTSVAISLSKHNELNSILRININEKIKLDGLILTNLSYENATGMSITWSINDTSIDLSTIALFPVEFKLSTFLPSNNQLGNLFSIPCNFLVNSFSLKPDSTYKLTLSVNHSYASSINVFINGGPSSGSYVVMPQSGIEFETTFYLHALLWLDNDLPLTYKFGYLSTPSSDFIPVSSRIESPFASTLFPASPDILSMVIVFDCYLAYTNQTTNITVSTSKNVLKNALLLRSINDSLSYSSLPSNIRASYQIVAVAGSMFNRIDCSMATASYCTKLFRNNCNQRTNTCGTCLPGYVSLEQWDSNWPCLIQDTAGVEVVRKRSLLVMNVNKTCPMSIDNNVCAGNGYCLFINTNTNQNLTSCLIDDPYCIAKCHCIQNYFGDMCQLTKFDYDQDLSIKSKLLVTLLDLSLYADWEEENEIQSQVNLLALLSKNNIAWTDRDVDLMLSYSNTLIAYASNLCAYEAMLPILTSINSILSFYGNSFNHQYLNDTTHRVEATMDKFIDMVLSDIVPGQSDVNVLLSEMRLSIKQLELFSNLKNPKDPSTSYSSSYPVLLSLPLTYSEINKNLSSMAIKMLHTRVMEGSEDLLVIAGYSFKSKLYQPQYTYELPYHYGNQSNSYSNTFKTILANLNHNNSMGKEDFKCVDTNFTAVTCQLEVNLLHNHAVSFIQNLTEVVETNVCYDLDYMSFTYTCATNPSASLVIDCKDISRIYHDGVTVTDRCPLVNITSVCKDLVVSYNADYSNPFRLSSCITTDYSSYQTTCLCNITDDSILLSENRRVNIIDSKNSISSTYIAQSNVQTTTYERGVSESNRLQSPEVSRIVLISMSAFTLLVLLCTFTSYGSDRNKHSKDLTTKAMKDKQAISSQQNDDVGSIINAKRKVAELRNDDYQTKQREKQQQSYGVRLGMIDPKLVKARNEMNALFLRHLNIDTIKNTLPVVLQIQETTVQVVHLLMKEIQVYHRWIGIITHYSLQYPRLYRVIALSFQILGTLFFSALLFASINPDDGSCALINNERDCIYDSSTYIQDKSKCIWYHSNRSCVFRQPDPLPNTIVLVVIIASLLSVPIARLIEYILIKLAIPDQTESRKSSLTSTSNTLSLSGTNAKNPWSIFRNHLIHSFPIYPATTSTTQNNISLRSNNISNEVTSFDQSSINTMNDDPFGNVNDNRNSYDLIDTKQYFYFSDRLLVYFGFQTPIRLQSVDFIDGVNINLELDILVRRIQYFSKELVRNNKILENKKLLASWGMDANGEFRRSVLLSPNTATNTSITVTNITASKNTPACWQVEDRSEILISRELQQCRDLTKTELYWMGEMVGGTSIRGYFLDHRYHQDASTIKKNNTGDDGEIQKLERIHRMFYLLQRDILGSSIAANILDKKSIRDCFYQDLKTFPIAFNYQIDSAVFQNSFYKTMTWIILLVIFIMMLLYILQFAFIQSIQLQRAWLSSLFIFLVVDSIFISTSEVLIMQYLLPRLILNDMRIVKDLMIQLIDKYTKVFHREVNAGNISQSSHRENFNGRHANSRAVNTLLNKTSMDEEHIPNITEFFFVSTKLATYFHEYTESQFVLTFSTMLPPGALFPSSWWRPLSKTLSLSPPNSHMQPPQRIVQQNNTNYKSVFIYYTCISFIVYLCHGFICSPLIVQDLLIQCWLVIFWGILAMITAYLYQVQAILILFPLVVVFIIYAIAFSLCQYTNNQQHSTTNDVENIDLNIENSSNSNNNAIPPSIFDSGDDDIYNNITTIEDSTHTKTSLLGHLSSILYNSNNNKQIHPTSDIVHNINTSDNVAP